MGSTGQCNQHGGSCECREGFAGEQCERCATGFKGDKCEKCDCDVRGTMPGGECESFCQCKVGFLYIYITTYFNYRFCFQLYVESPTCDRCLPGYFGLRADNPEGCVKCYCSGIAQSCESSDMPNSVVCVFLLNTWIICIWKTSFSSTSRWRSGASLIYQELYTPFQFGITKPAT